MVKPTLTPGVRTFDVDLRLDGHQALSRKVATAAQKAGYVATTHRLVAEPHVQRLAIRHASGDDVHFGSLYRSINQVLGSGNALVSFPMVVPWGLYPKIMAQVESYVDLALCPAHDQDAPDAVADELTQCSSVVVVAGRPDRLGIQHALSDLILERMNFWMRYPPGTTDAYMTFE